MREITDVIRPYQPVGYSKGNDLGAIYNKSTEIEFYQGLLSEPVPDLPVSVDFDGPAGVELLLEPCDFCELFL